MKQSLLGYSTYIFDLDGCICFGREAAPGAVELVTLLKTLGKQVCFLSNNSTLSPEELRALLARMGLETGAGDYYLASTLLSRFLLEQHGTIRVAVSGSSALAGELARFGHVVTPLGASEATCLVVGRDVGFTFERLRLCVKHLEAGCLFYATNADTHHPNASGGREPETGALTAAVTAVTGRAPTSVGKPSQYAFRCLLQDIRRSPDECLMIGDSHATDVLGAASVGMDACWIELQQTAPMQDHAAPNTGDKAAFSFPFMASMLEAVRREAGRGTFSELC